MDQLIQTAVPSFIPATWAGGSLAKIGDNMQAGAANYLHRAPIPEEEPLPGEEPAPEDEPVPHPDPVLRLAA